MGRLAETQRKLLEQLMGPEAMGVIPQDVKFWDQKVCRNFLCGTCPHELFTNTKMDLGPCPKQHSQRLRDEYNTAIQKPSDAPISKMELVGLQQEYERSILAFVEDCDRRIRTAQRRLEKTPEENNKTTALMREIGEIQSAYDLAMQEVESLGEKGKIDESMAELAKAEALKGEKQDKERELQTLTDTAGASGHQKLRVCDICGAYLSVLDSDRRLADHFGGKMHLGYLTLRQTIEEWRARGPVTVANLAAHSQAKAANAELNGDAEDADNGDEVAAQINGFHDAQNERGGGGRERDRERADRRDRDRDRIPPPPLFDGTPSSGAGPGGRNGASAPRKSDFDDVAPSSHSRVRGFDDEPPRHSSSHRDRDRGYSSRSRGYEDRDKERGSRPTRGRDYDDERGDRDKRRRLD